MDGLPLQQQLSWIRGRTYGGFFLLPHQLRIVFFSPIHLLEKRDDPTLA